MPRLQPLVIRSGLVLFALVLAGGAPAALRAQSDPADWTSLAGGDEILALAIDPSDPDRLWAGTEGGGLLIWDLPGGSFEQHLFPSRSGLLSNEVYDIAFDGLGDAWLATGLGVTQVQAGRWIAHPIGEDPSLGLPPGPLTAIAVDAEDAVWAGGPFGLARLPAGGVDWERVEAVDFVPGDEEGHPGPGQGHVADILAEPAPDGRVLLAHGRGGAGSQPALSILDPATGEWRHIAAIEPRDDPTSGPRTDKVMAMARDADGLLWMATWSRGVVTWDGQMWEELGAPSADCGDRLWSIAESEGRVWVGCGDENRGRGVARWDGTWESWSADDGLPSAVIPAIALAGDGRAYLGTNGFGNDQPGGSGGWGILPFEDVPGEALRTAPRLPWSNDILALAFEPDGTVWVGTRGAGLMRSAPPWQDWELFTVESTRGGLVGDTVADMVLREGTLWVATLPTTLEGGRYVDGGVSRLTLDTGVWGPPLRSDNSELPDNDTGSLALGPDGRLWIGLGSVGGGKGGPTFSGDGVAVYDPDAGTWERFDFEGRALAGNTVVDLAAGAGQVWVAASYHPDSQNRRTGGGVSRYLDGAWASWSRDDEGFLTFHGSGVATDQDPFIDGDVRSVTIDRSGMAWAGTYVLESGSLSSRWPFVDAVVNRQVAPDAWANEVFEGSGWVSALVEDSAGQVWAGTTRGHFRAGGVAFQEHSPSGNRLYDDADGGLRVWGGAAWRALDPANSGLVSRAITALAVDPTTGHVWVGTENGGISVYRSGQPLATATPGPSPTRGPTATAASPGATVPPLVTLPPAERTVAPRPTDDGDGGDEDEEQPPPEVPEASTLVLLGAGLAGLAGWMGLRRRAGGH